MKITDSSVALSSNTEMQKSHIVKENINLYENEDKNNLQKEDMIFISDKALEMQKSDECVQMEFELSQEDKNKLRLIEEFIQNLTGKKFRIRVLEKMLIREKKATLYLSNNQNSKEEVNYTFNYNYEERYFEKESMSFKARGSVSTGSGEKFNFSLQLNMARSFKYEKNLNIKGSGKRLVDPLYINLDGGEINLSTDKYKFDLDNDGEKESISLPSSNGFLTLDKNNDGVINNGSELFGAITGDGFAELAAYDIDDNGWLDESDPVLSSLKIWTRDASGKDHLESVVEEGVGAIYLGNVISNYSLKDENNILQGLIKSNGIYLSENGNPGFIHQLDLAIDE